MMGSSSNVKEEEVFSNYDLGDEEDDDDDSSVETEKEKEK